MYIFLSLFLLPFFEIAGFIVIGGEIGFLNTLLWTIGATVLGLFLLKTGGLSTLHSMRSGTPQRPPTLADLFDHLAIFVAALLLVFPGFISDFLAIPFLIAPLRGWIFDHVKERHTEPHTKGSPHRETDRPPANDPSATVIEGEYTVKTPENSANDDNNHLPKP